MGILATGDWVTAERLRRIATIACIISLLCVIWLFATSKGTLDVTGRPLGTDFSNVWTAGQMVLDGRAAAAWSWPDHLPCNGPPWEPDGRRIWLALPAAFPSACGSAGDASLRAGADRLAGHDFERVPGDDVAIDAAAGNDPPDARRAGDPDLPDAWPQRLPDRAPARRRADAAGSAPVRRRAAVRLPDLQAAVRADHSAAAAGGPKLALDRGSLRFSGGADWAYAADLGNAGLASVRRQPPAHAHRRDRARRDRLAQDHEPLRGYPHVGRWTGRELRGSVARDGR